MTMTATSPALPAPVADDVAWLRQQVESRAMAAGDYFSRHARTIVQCAAVMADRFFDGGTLWIAGVGTQASDALHNAVEFLHPVLPGCRALPAFSLVADPGTVTGVGETEADDVFARQLRVLGRPGDIALVLAVAPVPRAIPPTVAAARDIGMYTVALVSGEGSEVFADVVLATGDRDPRVAQELHLATYHILWELVHIILNHRGIPTAKEPGR